MSHTIPAVFENGVFRPLEKVELDNGEEVEVILLDRADTRPKRSREILSAIAGLPMEDDTNGFSGEDHDPGLRKESREAPSSPFTVRLTTLAPEGFDLLREIPAMLQQTEDSFVATFFDANLAASGDTREEAVQNLKTLIVEIFEDLESEPFKKLGPEPRRQLAVLQETISRKR